MTELLVSLTGGPALPGADVGWPYNVDLNALLSVTGDKTYNSANVEWAITSGELPNGLSLGANGSKCWGRAGFGQLGNSTVSTDQATPIEVQP